MEIYTGETSCTLERDHKYAAIVTSVSALLKAMKRLTDLIKTKTKLKIIERWF